MAHAMSAAAPPVPHVVFILVPTLDPPLRMSKPGTHAEMQALADELRGTTLLGAPIAHVHVGPKPQPVAPDVRRQRTLTHNAPAFMPNNRRKVRASAKDWAGEKDGLRIDRTTERIKEWDR